MLRRAERRLASPWLPLMNHVVKRLLFLLLLVGTARATGPVPLVRAHAHNDYAHQRPLVDALERGFCSVEADVHLVDGALLVAHNRESVQPGRTLSALYLEPLRERVRANGGRVFRGGPTVILLVDVKSAAAPTYVALHEVLQGYAEMLTTFRDGGEETRAVTVIVSGNRTVAEMAAQPLRFAAVDGRPVDLERDPPTALVPLISADWNSIFAWRWEGAMTEPARAELRAWVDRAHNQQRKVRFWNTPDRAVVWRELIDAGVDLVGTDDLAGLQEFLRPPAPRTADPPPARSPARH
jgi:hypothetical protein